MDTLYYSNHCKHSQRVLQFLVKGNLADKLNFLCIDKRTRDPNTYQVYLTLENGQRVMMPPHVHSVPALLLAKQNYRVILGEEIIQHYHAAVSRNQGVQAHRQAVEPMGVSLAQSNQGMMIQSEQYSAYNLTPDELSAKGTGGRRPLYNYVSANQDVISIHTPPDTYQPDKVSNSVTLDGLQQKRMDEIQQRTGPNVGGMGQGTVGTWSQSQFVPKV